MSMEAVVAFWQSLENDKAQPGSLDDGARRFEVLSRMAHDSGFACTAKELSTAETITRFWKQVFEDETLQREVMQAEKLAPEPALILIHKIAVESGFDCSREDFDAFTRAQLRATRLNKVELSDQQLDNITGGIESAPYFGVLLKYYK